MWCSHNNVIGVYLAGYSLNVSFKYQTVSQPNIFPVDTINNITVRTGCRRSQSLETSRQSSDGGQRSHMICQKKKRRMSNCLINTKRPHSKHAVFPTHVGGLLSFETDPSLIAVFMSQISPQCVATSKINQLYAAVISQICCHNAKKNVKLCIII